MPQISDVIKQKGKRTFVEELAQECCSMEWKDSNFRAWNICHEAFKREFDKAGRGADVDVAYLCVHLSAYLACWGMYRGSGFISRANCMVHENAVRLVLENCGLNEIGVSGLRDRSDEILELYHRIRQAYSHEGVRCTDTLATKVMLGTLACILAYDTYVKLALKKWGICQSVSEKSLSCLADEYERITASELGRELKNMGEPDMKVLDTCLFACGREPEKK